MSEPTMKEKIDFERGYGEGYTFSDEFTSEESDMVNHPPHYNQKGIECIDAIEAVTDTGFEYYLQGNIMKYIWRYRYKEGIQDLKKARWYLDKLIEIRNDTNKS
tara:strand:- start:326 stop:637 length:312 start_codon:yes stop_codon:yes gene_type:complete